MFNGNWISFFYWAVIVLVLAGTAGALGGTGEAPPVLEVPAVDAAALAAEDADREASGLPPRFAVPFEVLVRPSDDGVWKEVDESTDRWTLRVRSAGALSLNFGFTAYDMPAGGELLIYAADGSHQQGPFTAADNELHGELWTPVVLADDVIVEVTLPKKARDLLILELTSINVGYRFFGEKSGPETSGWCNNDVICPEGDDWRDEIPCVGVISTGGSTFCTGFMINNTAEDETPFFMTAQHCGINQGNASSLVVYWNFESPECGMQGGGSLADNQTGSYYRASYGASDYTLVELDDMPNPDWGVTYCGWDRSEDDPITAVAIHHPSTDEKSISFEYDPCTTTSYLGTSVPGDGTHIRVEDWDDGTTEPGSSGSPLFNENHHVVGQLHGGYAACGNDLADWYGRISVSWAQGLSQYLDPGQTGALTLDTLNPAAVGLRVSPNEIFYSEGDPGGPFTPAVKAYVVENQGEEGFDYEVTVDVDWLTVSNGSGYLAAGEQAFVTVAINDNANHMPVGVYPATISFVNLTTHEGDTTRASELQVGVPVVVYEWNMDTDPGWDMSGQWAWGQPTGGGGQYGGPDPTSGYTGSHVCGYNLSGDYTNGMPEFHLTSGPIDCSELSQVSLRFWRWLGVEQPLYDHAYVRVSTNGTSWTTLWENTDDVTDIAWQEQVFDISDIADGAAMLYLRWTMGTTDSSWRYCGWNIDDVQIWGIVPQPAGPGDMNCDGVVSFDDIAGFITALESEEAYQSAYPDCEWLNGDLDADGVVTFDDIAPFVDLLGR